MSYGNGDGETDISIYVTSERLMNFSSDTSVLSSHFLDQAYLRNPLKNPIRIIYCLKYDIGWDSLARSLTGTLLLYFILDGPLT
jgi:hypothetical protein